MLCRGRIRFPPCTLERNCPPVSLLHPRAALSALLFSLCRSPLRKARRLRLFFQVSVTFGFPEGYRNRKEGRFLEDLQEVYRQHAQTVYKFLLSQCGSEDLAEELTQETFYQAVRSIQRFDGTCKLSVWLCQIAKHLWYQHLRKRRREAPLPEEDAVPLCPSAEEEAISRQGHRDLLRQVHALKEPYRETVYLRLFGDLSFREIGDVLRKTETWARVTFYRGKEQLKNGGMPHEK